MALRRDRIESEQSSVAKDLRSAISSRPLLWIGGGFTGLSVLALVSVSADPRAEARDAQPQETPVLVPDSESAEAYAALHRAEAGVARPEPPLELETTTTVPAIGDAPGAAGVPRARVDSSKDIRRALIAEHRLQVLRTQLALRAAAYTESSNVEAMEQSRRERDEAARALVAGPGGLGGEADSTMGDLNALAARSGATLDAVTRAAARGPGELGAGQDPHMRAEKKDFLQRGGEQMQPGELESEVVEARSPYRLLMGWKIPGVLQTGINSEGPGPISAFVRKHVFDTTHGRHLLIPKGSQLVGTYSGAVSQGQRRVQIAWTRINFPNGSTLDLGSMPGTDQEGVTGFSHSVDTHFLKRLGSALLASLFTVGYELTMPQKRTVLENAAHRGVGESLTQFGIEEARRLGQQPPTLRIPVGYKFDIFVTKDITFRGPYEDGIERSQRR